jgi:nucleoside-diphosphate-sugar epimerase
MLKKTILKKIIIIGGSGFVGNSCIKIFKKKKIRFFSISSKNCNLLKKNSHKYLEKNINNGDKVLFISAKAPCKDLDSFKKNINMISPLIKASHKKKISQLIYISSDAVYADQKTKINENSKVKPSSIHGLMHQTRENLLKIYFKDILTIVRPTLIYGPDDTHNGYGPNNFSRLAIKNQDINVFGKGEEIRDHVFIDDVANLVLLTINKKFTGVINAVSGSPISFKKIAKLIIKKFKSKSKIVSIKREIPMPHNGYRCFNISKIKKNFLFKPTKFDKGVSYLKNINI